MLVLITATVPCKEAKLFIKDNYANKFLVEHVAIMNFNANELLVLIRHLFGGQTQSPA